MSSNPVMNEQFVPYHIYERDMERINRTLDKLIEYVQLTQIAQAHDQGHSEAIEERQDSSHRTKLVVLAAFLALVASLILDAVQVLVG